MWSKGELQASPEKQRKGTLFYREEEVGRAVINRVLPVSLEIHLGVRVSPSGLPTSF